MTQTELFLMRRQKGIKLNQIAKSIGCSIALLSKYEHNKVAMDASKVNQYKDYILNNQRTMEQNSKEQKRSFTYETAN